MPAKTAMKAENQSKEGPINTTVSKSGSITYVFVWYYHYSSFASKPIKIDERYGFITICWWDPFLLVYLFSSYIYSL